MTSRPATPEERAEECEVRTKLHVMVVGASMRKESLNVRLATLAAQTVRARGAEAHQPRMAELDCPAYNQDVETTTGIPQGAREFCRMLKESDALMIASPEYNASIPGYLKNTIDWVSRFRPQPFNGKQAFLLSASPAMSGGNRGLWSLRIPLEHLGARVYPDMFSLALALEAFGENGRLKNDVLQERFDDTIGCFLDLVEAAKHYPGLKKQWIEFLGEQPNPATDRIETSDVEAEVVGA
jgi:chromate reductase, NAD(P)H dehydrogenase (quinone)